MTNPGHEAAAAAERPRSSDAIHSGSAVAREVSLTRREVLARERAAREAPPMSPVTVDAAPLAFGVASVNPAPTMVAAAPAAGTRRALRATRAAEASAAPTVRRRASVESTPGADPGVLSSAALSTPSTPVPAPRPTVRAAARTRRSSYIAAPVVAPRPSAQGRTLGQRRTRRFGVLGAMAFVGATIVATSVPANAYYVDTPEAVAIKLSSAAQSGVTVGGAPTTIKSQGFIASDATVATGVGRDGYSVTTPASQYKSTSSGTFTNDASAAVQWPFAVGVPISSGFGARQVANCGFCSTFHQGLDFTPGAGSPIQIIADGTVSKVEQGGGALGYNVWIEHVIGGKKITSVYAHMIAGSIKVTEGETVKVGQIVGQVGSTGNSTGAHLHFEIHIDGVPVDPYPWLEANAGAI